MGQTRAPPARTQRSSSAPAAPQAEWGWAQGGAIFAVYYVLHDLVSLFGMPTQDIPRVYVLCGLKSDRWKCPLWGGRTVNVSVIKGDR